MGRCSKCVKATYKTNCGECGKMKIKLPKSKAVGLNKNVAQQAITNVNTTIVQLTNGPFSFNNLTSQCNGCCNPCGGNNNYNNNNNIICLSCEGLYNVTVFISVNSAPLANIITLVLDVNDQQMMALPLTGSGQSLSFSTNLNLCATDKIKFRIYFAGSYSGNIIDGNISIVKVNDRIGCH